MVLCGPAGVPGAGGPGRCVCRWAAARPRAVRAASFARRVVSKPGQAPPPPTGTAAGPSGALHTSGAWCADWWFGGSPRSPARPRRRSSILHVIPLRLIQTLNMHHWNCNVFAWSRKVTVGNYVRLLVSAGPPAAFFAAVGPCVSQPARALRRSASVCVFWIGSSVLDRNGASG